MIDALGLEAAAIRKKGSGTRVELRGGERIAQADGSWLYRFVVSEDLNLRDDTPIRVTVGQEDIPGTLVSFRDGVLIVALEKDLGPKIAAARLVANDSFLIERLQEKLQKVNDGEIQFNRQAADRVLGLADLRTADAEPHPQVTGDGTLNAEQISAVRRSLGSDTTFVWGPPGTGKTTALARIIEAHYRAGRSVLLVSNTNIAVDTALERVAERLKGEPDFHQGLVLRQGPAVKKELLKKFEEQVVLEKIVVRLSESLQREKANLASEATSLQAEERSDVAMVEQIERLAVTRLALAERENSRDAGKSDIAAREKEAEQYRGRATKLLSNLERARAMGALRRFFLGLHPELLAREAEAANRHSQAAELAARTLASGLPTLQSEIGSLRSTIDRLTAEIQRCPPVQQIQARLETLRARVGQIRARIAAIDDEIAEIEQRVIARCKVLATTVYRTYLGKNPIRQFDVVVVDEASMLMPPLVYYAAGLATQSVTVAGDFRQLPPIVMSVEPLATEWLKRDVCEISGIPPRLRLRQPIPQLVALSVQYRMREPICAVINKLFYPDRPLNSDPSIAGRPREPSFPFGSASLFYVDTSPFHPWAAHPVGTYSRYNLFHALLIRNVLLHLGEAGFLRSEGGNEDVGVVSPYARQARLI